MQAQRLDVMTTPAPHASSRADAPAGAVRDRVSPQEWQARVELAALYRLAAHFRWTDTIYTHISMRVPGTEQFLINPFGYLQGEVTASSLVKVSSEAGLIDDPVGLGINRAGFIIHSAIHVARPDVSCVLHTHTRAGVAVSTHPGGLLPISPLAAYLADKTGYHDAEGIAVRPDERTRLAENIGSGSVLILRNHGLLVAGRTAAETFFLMSCLERACEIQVAAVGAGDALGRLNDEAIAAAKAATEPTEDELTLRWGAMLRLVERNAPDYKS